MGGDRTYDIAVIGGGPAGMLAAGQASLDGASVVLVEKMDTLGKKLSITGKKRCNLTNSADLPDFIDHFGPNGRFLHQTFARFFREDLIDFLQSIGISTEAERGGRIFPSNGDALFVTQQLIEWVHKTGVQVITKSPVKRLILENNHITGIEISTGSFINSRAAVLCTGGATFSATGSTGDGYHMASAVGHTVVPLRPALVPLETAGTKAQRLQGLSLRNISMRVKIDGISRIDAFGEILFTHFGISGPLVLTHSGVIVDALRAGKQVQLSIDLKPSLDEEKLENRLLRDLDKGGKQHVRTMLKRLLPSKMTALCAEETRIPLDLPCHQVSAQYRKQLLKWLKDFRLDVTRPLPLDKGMVTMGGVTLKEIDPRTMMSKIVDGLFFAGEVLDLAADTGGFNLQTAFSTGWLAGHQAAAYMQKID